MGYVDTTASRLVAATFVMVSLLVATGTKMVAVFRLSVDSIAAALQQAGTPSALTEPTMTDTPGARDLRIRSSSSLATGLIMNDLGSF